MNIHATIIIMNNATLEKIYEQAILPNYQELDVANIRWKDHGQIGPDAWAHYFEDVKGREYALVFEDFPGSTFFDDDFTHEVVSLDGEISIEFGAKHTQHAHYAPNITGYFTLYRERDRINT